MRFVNLIYKKINKKVFFIAIFLFLFFIVLGNFVYAADAPRGTDLSWWQEDLLVALSQIIYVPVWIIGLLIGQMMGFFISAAQFNGFIDAEPVKVGWEIIRDLCNMGFIIILLIIAVGSILRIESYSYRNWLPKLVIMAVLINFSKAICGVVIDISQIVMLTFVSGISEIGMGNFADMIGLKDFLNFSEWKETLANSDEEISALSIAGTMILALVFSIIALVVIAAITLVLVIRIAALWILVILSPFAFLFSASPAGNKYASQWVQNFTKWVFTGPVLAFFIWLSFLTVKGTSNAIFHPEGNMLANEGISVGLASIGSAEVMGTFILAIVMLMASLIVAQQLGGMAASVAGGAYRSITSRGDRIVKGGFDKIRKTTVGAARAVPDAALSRMARSENVQGFLDRTSGSSSRFIRFSGTGALARKTLGSLRYKERQEEEQARRYVSKFDDNPHTIAKLANQRAFGARANMIKRVAQEKMPSSEMFASRRDNRPITQKTQNEAFRRLNDLGYQEFNNLTPNELFRLSNEGVFEKGDLSPQISGSLSTNSQTARADRGAIIRGLREYYARESGLDINDINIDETSGQLNVNGHLTGQRLWRSAANQADFGDQNVNNAYTRFMADVDSSQSKKESPSISKITGVNKLLRGEKRDNVRLALDFDQIDLKGAGANIKGKDKDKIKEKLFGLLKNQGYNEDELKNITEKIESSKSLQLINKGRGGQSARAVIAHEAMHSQLESVDQNKLRKVWEGIDNDKRKFIDDEIRKIWHNGKNMSENDVMHEYFADAMANTRKTWVREKGSQLDKETKNNLKDIGLRPGRLKEIEHSNEPKIQEKVRDYKKNQVQVEENRVADTIDTGNLEDSIKDLGNTFKDTGEKIKNSMSEVGKVDMFGGKTNYADQFKKDADSEIKYKTDKSIKEQSKNIKEFSSQIQQQDEPDKREKKNDVKKYNIKESNIEYNIKKIIKKNNQEKEENINEENNFQNDKE